MRDNFSNKRLDFYRKFNIKPTHYIMNIEEYQKARLLSDYVPYFKSENNKETLFGLEIIISRSIEETKCAVVY